MSQETIIYQAPKALTWRNYRYLALCIFILFGCLFALNALYGFQVSASNCLILAIFSLIMPLVLGLADLWRDQVTVDSKGISQRLTSKTSNYISWADIQKADFGTHVLTLKAGKVNLHLNQKHDYFPELFERIIAERPDLFAPTETRRYISVVAVFFALAIPFIASMAIFSEGIPQLLYAAVCALNIYNILLLPHSLRIEDNRFVLKSIARKRVIRRSDIVSIEWINTRSHKKAISLNTKVTLKAGKPLNLVGYIPDDYDLYQNLQRWLAGDLPAETETPS